MKTLTKTAVLSFFLFLSPLTFSQSATSDWAVGIKLGDPDALSIKKYNSTGAWEFNIGRMKYWTRPYDYDYYFQHDNRFKNYKYLGHKDHTGVNIQLRKLWNKSLSLDGVSGLDWYYGIGGQLFTNSYYYQYKDENDIFHEERYTNSDIGVDGIIGLEYFFQEIPLSMSLDVNVTMLLIDRPFYLISQSGLGIRYNF